MKKSDLKQNMIVELRNRKRYLVIEDVETPYAHQDLLFMASNEFEIGSGYTEDLLDKDNASKYDIIKVMKWEHFKGLQYLSTAKINEFEVLWERPVTIDWQPWELEVLKHIPTVYKKIYRREDGNIQLKDDLYQLSVLGVSFLPVDLISLKPNKNDLWLNIDTELARYGMNRDDKKNT